MNVLQVLLGQSASVMQPKFAFAPPTQAPVSQVPDVGQSASLQHGVLAASGARQRPVSLTHVPVPPHASVVPQPPPPVQLAPGGVPPAVSDADAPVRVSVVPLHEACVIELP